MCFYDKVGVHTVVGVLGKGVPYYCAEQLAWNERARAAMVLLSWMATGYSDEEVFYDIMVICGLGQVYCCTWYVVARFEKMVLLIWYYMAVSVTRSQCLR